MVVTSSLSPHWLRTLLDTYFTAHSKRLAYPCYGVYHGWQRTVTVTRALGFNSRLGQRQHFQVSTPPMTGGSRIYKLGPHWHGFREVTRLMIFGDSFTDTGYHWQQIEVKPDTKNPLGTEFPGVTWAEADKPNWVGHLITKYCPHPRFDPAREEQSQEYRDHALLVYNYAKGGDKVDGVRRQIQRFFLPKVGKKPEWASWNADNTLFLTWIGINDCAGTIENSQNIKDLFELQEQLYVAGARNFLFIDVPPVHRGPLGLFVPRIENYQESRDNWNALLPTAIENFTAAHEDITTLFFSSTKTFEKLFDNPTLHGFDPADVGEFGGPMWVDHVHPTSRVHDFFANEFAEFMNTVPARNTQ